MLLKTIREPIEICLACAWPLPPSKSPVLSFEALQPCCPVTCSGNSVHSGWRGVKPCYPDNTVSRSQGKTGEAAFLSRRSTALRPCYSASRLQGKQVGAGVHLCRDAGPRVAVPCSPGTGSLGPEQSGFRASAN